MRPNPSVNATRTSRRLGARGRAALSSASRPKPPAGTGALPQTLGLGSAPGAATRSAIKTAACLRHPVGVSLQTNSRTPTSALVGASAERSGSVGQDNARPQGVGRHARQWAVATLASPSARPTTSRATRALSESLWQQDHRSSLAARTSAVFTASSPGPSVFALFTYGTHSEA